MAACAKAAKGGGAAKKTSSASSNGSGNGAGGTYDYDLVIIGCGVGGHGAALHAVEKGMKVAVIEGHDVGGTCVNRGCVPSKALLAASGRVREMRNEMHLKSMGIQARPSASVRLVCLRAAARAMSGWVGNWHAWTIREAAFCARKNALVHARALRMLLCRAPVGVPPQAWPPPHLPRPHPVPIKYVCRSRHLACMSTDALYEQQIFVDHVNETQIRSRLLPQLWPPVGPPIKTCRTRARRWVPCPPSGRAIPITCMFGSQLTPQPSQPASHLTA